GFQDYPQVDAAHRPYPVDELADAERTIRHDHAEGHDVRQPAVPVASEGMAGRDDDAQGLAHARDLDEVAARRLPEQDAEIEAMLGDRLGHALRTHGRDAQDQAVVVALEALDEFGHEPVEQALDAGDVDLAATQGFEVLNARAQLLEPGARSVDV